MTVPPEGQLEHQAVGREGPPVAGFLPGAASCCVHLLAFVSAGKSRPDTI
jgi:hypothetical protein